MNFIDIKNEIMSNIVKEIANRNYDMERDETNRKTDYMISITSKLLEKKFNISLVIFDSDIYNMRVYLLDKEGIYHGKLFELENTEEEELINKSFYFSDL